MNTNKQSGQKVEADAEVREGGGTTHPAPSVGNQEPRPNAGDTGDIDLAPGVLSLGSSSKAKKKNRGKGAPPSNTAPANYINTPETTKILRFGVDSLYLSYPGQLATEWDQRLTGLKLAAQSEDDTGKAKAQVKMGEHLFEVR